MPLANSETRGQVLVKRTWQTTATGDEGRMAEYRKLGQMTKDGEDRGWFPPRSHLTAGAFPKRSPSRPMKLKWRRLGGTPALHGAITMVKFWESARDRRRRMAAKPPAKNRPAEPYGEQWRSLAKVKSRRGNRCHRRAPRSDDLVALNGTELGAPTAVAAAQ